MLRHGAKQQLKSLLTDSKKSVIAYMKTLSPSGVELEIMSLANFEFSQQSDVSIC